MRRRRQVLALFGTAALMNLVMAMVSPVATIAAAEALGPAWGGLPNTAAVVGTGVGAVLLSRTAAGRGWRFALAAGYAAATAGGVFGVAALASDDVAGLSLAMLLLGLGNAGALLSRYAAADRYPAHRRGFVIGAVVWAGALGAVGGPLLLGPLAALGRYWAGTELTGPFVCATLVAAMAGAATSALPARRRMVPRARVPLRDLVRVAPARSALAVMGTAQVVMAAVMTAAPLDMHLHHRGLASVGMVLAGHTAGMFALAPLSGWLLDRYGTRPVMLAGLIVLAVSALLAAATAGAGPRAVALFLLGYGWNLCFVGGSGHLARDLSGIDHTQVEGAVDAAVWGLAAVASLASTVVLAGLGYPLLALLSAALVLPAAVGLLVPARQRQFLSPTPEAGGEPPDLIVGVSLLGVQGEEVSEVPLGTGSHEPGGGDVRRAATKGCN
ncbi:MFS transporter [Micromonospora maritima]|uniref:MFS transporter n=1 Tax=Micromonospora maritima TaxID=986711 RepID=A0ABW7ZJI0_9ACTN